MKKCKVIIGMTMERAAKLMEALDGLTDYPCGIVGGKEHAYLLIDQTDDCNTQLIAGSATVKIQISVGHNRTELANRALRILGPLPGIAANQSGPTLSIVVRLDD